LKHAVSALFYPRFVHRCCSHACVWVCVSVSLSVSVPAFPLGMVQTLRSLRFHPRRILSPESSRKRVSGYGKCTQTFMLGARVPPRSR
jgi:hypothetical protein